MENVSNPLLLHSNSLFSTVSAMLTVGEVEKLDKIARRCGCSRDAIVAFAIEDFLQRRSAHYRHDPGL